MPNSTKSTESHFGAVAIALHWISALLILVLLGTGFRAGFATDPEVNAAVLRIHLPAAGVFQLLTLG